MTSFTSYINRYETEDSQGKFDIEMFLKIFESYRDVSQNEIESLIQENNVLFRFKLRNLKIN